MELSDGLRLSLFQHHLPCACAVSFGPEAPKAYYYRFAKSARGVVGFSRNLTAYHRWCTCITRHKRATYLESTFGRVGMNEDENNVHKSNSPAQMRRSSDDVHNLIGSFKKFLDPLEIDDGKKDLLFCLSSGKPASGKVMNDLLNFWTTGENAAQAFIESNWVNKK